GSKRLLVLGDDRIGDLILEVQLQVRNVDLREGHEQGGARSRRGVATREWNQIAGLAEVERQQAVVLTLGGKRRVCLLDQGLRLFYGRGRQDRHAADRLDPARQGDAAFQAVSRGNEGVFLHEVRTQ